VSFTQCLQLTLRTAYTPRGPNSALSPAQRVRNLAILSVGTGSLVAIAAVWMRYQGYTLRGVWGWIARTTGLFAVQSSK
jgi:Ras family protein T1